VLDRGGRQTLVSLVDHRIGDVVVWREERGVFPAQVERLFEEGNHRGEVVRWPSSDPSIVGSRIMGIRARDVLGRDPDRSFVIAPHDADQTGIVGWKLIGAPLQTIHQSCERGIDKTLMGEASQHRRLPTP
jgi:hypothetical protein